MNIIKPSTISSVTAGSSNSLYPASNLLLASPKQLWKASSTSVVSTTLSFTIAGSETSICLLNADANTVAISIAGATVKVYTDQLTGKKNHWFTFAAPGVSTSVTITITRLSSTVVISATNLIVGIKASIDETVYPLQEELVDTSIDVQLLNGSSYYKKRDIVRRFSGVMLADRQNQLYNFVTNVIRMYGSIPVVTDIAPHLTDGMFIYGKFATNVMVSHSFPNHSYAQFVIQEAV